MSSESAHSKWYRLQIIVVINNNVSRISDCVESILDQEADFPFQIVFADCGSTDGSLLVIDQSIKSHPEKCTKVQYEGKKSKENALTAALNSLNCTFFTIVDIKDTWTDKYKIQKQVDFLEGHNLYNACGHQIKLYQSAVKSQILRGGGDQHIFTTEMMILHKGFPYESMVFRASGFDKLDLWQPILSAHALILAHLASFKAPIYLLPETLSKRYSSKISKKNFEKRITWLTVRILAIKRLNVESRLKHDEDYNQIIRSFHRSKFKLNLRFRNRWIREDFKEGVKKLKPSQKWVFILKSLWNWMLT
jgi:glycosyltransferase involved in cell wall biosynthesis